MARHLSQEWHLFALLGCVLLVSVVGFLTIDSSRSDAPSGQVVWSGCDRCPNVGDPVCAVRDTKALDYPNGCRAVCDGARIIRDGTCESIPKVGK